MTIVGIAAAGFEGVEAGGSTDFWIPLQNRPGAECVGESAGRWQAVHYRSDLVVPAADWPACAWVNRSQALAQLQPVFQIGGLYRAGRLADARREASGSELGRCQGLSRIRRRGMAILCAY